MKLEAGKYYKTRGGEKAYIAAVGSVFTSTSPQAQAIGWIEGANMNWEWGEDGTYCEDEVDDLDLVAEWREPIKVSGWVNVYKGGRQYFHDTKEAACRGCRRADGVHCVNFLTCIYVEGTEDLNGEEG